MQKPFFSGFLEFFEEIMQIPTFKKSKILLDMPLPKQWEYFLIYSSQNILIFNANTNFFQLFFIFSNIYANFSLISAKFYWARDFIFLFVDGSDPFTATQAFLAAYNGDTLDYVDYEPLETNSGAFIGGIALDIATEQFSHLQVQYISVS